MYKTGLIPFPLTDVTWVTSSRKLRVNTVKLPSYMGDGYETIVFEGDTFNRVKGIESQSYLTESGARSGHANCVTQLTLDALNSEGTRRQ